MSKYQYIKIAYRPNSGTSLEGYQEISGGIVLRNTDLSGNTVVFENFVSCDSWVIDAEPAIPEWAPDIIVDEIPPDAPSGEGI